MKKNSYLTVVILIVIMLFCVSCKKQADNKTGEATVTPEPHTAIDTATNSENSYSGEPSVSVTASLAYVFPTLEDNELYAACEVKNDSNCPCYITEVHYVLDVSGKTVEINSTQAGGSHYSILPNEVFYDAAWLDYDCADTDVAVVKSVDVKYEKCTDNCIRLEISDLFIVKNYPSFATVSGTIKQSQSTVSLNQIYIGFYDKSDKLLGVWYFTETAELAENQKKHFTSHLKSLPIENLTENTARINALGYGFNEKEN